MGSSKELKVDIRFICATNRDPLHEVQEGRFREDLYYRLHVIPVHMPALRERGSDIMLIAESLLKQYASDERKEFQGFTSDVANFFMQYNWPGNVRELSNVVRNVVVLNEGNMIDRSMLPNLMLSQRSNSGRVSISNSSSPAAKALSRVGGVMGDVGAPLQAGSGTQEIMPLWIEEKRIIETAIERCDGNVPRAAAFLEISASTIYRKKQQWEKAQTE